MSATDDTFTIGEALPRIAQVSAHADNFITVTWTDNVRTSRIETVDLAPSILRFKIYAPLRSNPDLFRTVHVIDGGYAVARGMDDMIDMSSSMVDELGAQTMTPADFAAFIKRHGYTLDSVAAELGISRRLAAYYQKERTIPRSIALACAFLDMRAAKPRPQQLQVLPAPEPQVRPSWMPQADPLVSEPLFAKIPNLEPRVIAGLTPAPAWLQPDKGVLTEPKVEVTPAASKPLRISVVKAKS